MTYQDENNNTMSKVLECLMNGDGLNRVGEVVQMLMNEAMKVEREKYLL